MASPRRNQSHRHRQGHRHRQSSLSLSIAPNSHSAADLPPIDALFLINFDVKAGYTIAWKRTVPNLDLDGRVEYKSLPSGLHTVRQDLIYFVDGAHAGLSAFVNEPCEEEEARNARMIAVGILVPLSYGRLGRAWRHAQNLKELAAQLAHDRHRLDILEAYWLARKTSGKDELPNIPDTPTFEPNLELRPQSRGRSSNDHLAEHKLTPFHPAWSLVNLLDKFGPLIFPIQRAALLRKRILISSHAPVHQACDFVYGISILSNIPSSVAERLPSSSSTARLRPLFAIGVHDIPFLMDDYEAFQRRQQGSADVEGEAGSGWIACTTDSILAMKDTLWDMLITMPSEHSSNANANANANAKAWPRVEYPRGTPIRATQRDLRRFNVLRSGLVHIEAAAAAAASSTSQESNPSSSSSTPPPPPSQRRHSSPARPSTSHSHRLVRDEQDDGMESIIEPMTWAALAYNGYMWWASAGEQLRSEEQEEAYRDAALLADLGPAPHRMRADTRLMSPEHSTSDEPSLSASLAWLLSHRHGSEDGGGDGGGSSDGQARTELAIIAFFHRLTTQMLSVLADLVQSTDEAFLSRYRDNIDEEEEVEERQDGDCEDEGDVLLQSHGSLEPDDDATIMVDGHSVDKMGLDVWSVADAAFVLDLMETYFGRGARIEGKGVEICGVRVC